MKTGPYDATSGLHVRSLARVCVVLLLIKRQSCADRLPVLIGCHAPRSGRKRGQACHCDVAGWIRCKRRIAHTSADGRFLRLLGRKTRPALASRQLERCGTYASPWLELVSHRRRFRHWPSLCDGSARSAPLAIGANSPCVQLQRAPIGTTSRRVRRRGRQMPRCGAFGRGIGPSVGLRQTARIGHLCTLYKRLVVRDVRQRSKRGRG